MVRPTRTQVRGHHEMKTLTVFASIFVLAITGSAVAQSTAGPAMLGHLPAGDKQTIIAKLVTTCNLDAGCTNSGNPNIGNGPDSYDKSGNFFRQTPFGKGATLGNQILLVKPNATGIKFADLYPQNTCKQIGTSQIFYTKINFTAPAGAAASFNPVTNAVRVTTTRLESTVTGSSGTGTTVTCNPDGTYIVNIMGNGNGAISETDVTTTTLISVTGSVL